MKFRNKILCSFLPIVLIIGIIGFFAINYTIEEFKNDIINDASSNADKLVREIDIVLNIRIKRIKSYTKDIASDYKAFISKYNKRFKGVPKNSERTTLKKTINSGNSDNNKDYSLKKVHNNKLSKYLKTELAEYHKEEYGYKIYKKAVLTNKYGINIAQTKETSDYYHGDNIGWQKAKKEGSYIGDVNYNKENDTYSLDIWAKVENNKGDFLGVLIGEFNLQEIINIINKYPTSEDSSKDAVVRLLNSKGELIYSTVSGFKNFKKFGRKERFNKKNRSNSKISYEYRGDDKILAQAHLKNPKQSPWTILVQYDSNSIFSTVFQLRNFLIYTILVMILATLVTALFLSKIFSKPIRKLKNAAKRISEGNFDTSIDVDSKDELGSLAYSFIRMKEKLKDTLKIEKELAASKERAETLEEAEENLRSIIKSMGEALITTDSKGNVTRLNPVAEELTGWTKKEAEGKPLNEVLYIINAKTREICENPAEKVLNHREIAGLTEHTALISKEGKEYQISDTAAPIRDRNNNIEGVILVFRDVTEEYKKNEEMRKLQSAVEYSISGIGMIDINGKIVYVNQAFVDIFGYGSKSEFYSLKPTDLAEKEKTEELLDILFKEGSWSGELKAYKKDGTEFYIQMNNSAIFDDNNEVIGAIGTLHDITERKELEFQQQSLVEELRSTSERLEQSKIEYDKLTNSLSEIIYSADPKTFGIIYVNHAIETISGYSRDKFLNEPEFWKSLIHPEDKEPTIKELNNLVENKQTGEVEFRIIRKDGQIRSVLDGVDFEFNEDNQVKIIHGVIYDITSRKKAEEKNREFRQMIEQVNDAVFIVDYDSGKFVDVNQETCRTLGYTREELLRLEVKDIETTFTDTNTWKKYVKKATKGKGSDSIEGEQVTKDGTKFPVQVNHVFMKRKEGDRVIAIARDITTHKKQLEKIQIQKDYINSVFNSVSDMIVVLSPNGKIEEYNSSFRKSLEYSENELKQKDLIDLIDLREGKKENFFQNIKSTNNWDKVKNIELSFKTKSNNAIPVAVNTTKISKKQFAAGNKYVLSARDLTDVIKLQDAKYTINILSAMAENAQDAMIRVDDNFNIQSWNIASKEIFGYEENEMIGKNFNTLLTQYDALPDIHLESDEIDVMPAGLTLELSGKRKDGEEFPLELSFSTFQAMDKIEALCIIRDISERKKSQNKILNLNKQLKELAYYDPLTNCFSRRAFLEMLEKNIDYSNRNNTSFALLFIDLDNFKIINDTYGHDIGDEILKVAAERITKTIRKSDNLARFGGDEFLVLLHNIQSEEEALNVSQKIKTSINETFVIDRKNFYINLCIGVCLYPKDGTTTDELLRNSDIAMYSAKQQGKNCCSMYDTGQTENIRFLDALSNALSNDEFKLHYQPIVNKNGEVVFIEALLRWYSADLGLVPPNKFIYILEQNREIIRVGKWIVKTAINQIQQLNKNEKFKNLGVTINISSIQLEEKELPNIFQNHLDKSQVHPSNVSIELTESDNIAELSSNTDILNELRNNGIKIFLDDFGAGYSSLTTLFKIPFDIVKIDKFLINKLTGKKEDKENKLVAELISMLKELNYKVLAEGVETEEQFRILLNEDCDYFQGYYFSKPVENINELLTDNNGKFID